VGIYNLERIFTPNSVAVIGASNKPESIGRALMHNLQQGGYEGHIYPVHPKYPRILGLPAYPTVEDVNQAIDLAVIATPISTVPAIVEQCAGAGVKGAIIISAGGRETGKQGHEIEADIKRAADKTGLRIIGPNCVGVIAAQAKLYATFTHQMPLPGRMAFISQSGALIGAILDLSLKKQMGFSHFVSMGAMLDVDFGDLIDYLGNDPDVGSIVLYMEGLTHPRKFMSAARAVSRVKPIIVLKSGRSAAGAKAAATHTGSMAGAGAVYDAAFRRAGVVPVETIESLFDCAELVAKQPIPKDSGLAVITNAGGPGVMAADALAAFDLSPVSLTPKTLSRLDAFLPPFWSKGNPIDILGDATPERFRQAVEACVSAPEVSGLVIVFVPQAVSDAADVANTLSELLKGTSFPVFAVLMGGDAVEQGRRVFIKAGIPTYDTPERAVEAFMYMNAYARNLELLQQIPPKQHIKAFDKSRAEALVNQALAQNHSFLTEVEAKAVLSAYGIPVNLTRKAASKPEAVRLAQEMGYPVAMKILSRDILHKSEARGIHLNLKDAKQVREAFTRIMADARAYDPDACLDGVSIQSMVGEWDYELIAGAKKDSLFGPVILFGMGGVMTEILKDQAIALPPLNRLLARRLMEGTRVYQLLKGFRNRPPADLGRLEEILINISELVIDFPQIAELDINPLVVGPQGPQAVDARMVIAPSRIASPLHLVISPYPDQYETTTRTRGGLDIFIRPIKPEDAPLLLTLHHSLSDESIYYRFFSPLKSLPQEMLARFTQIDYDRDMALVAMEAGQPEERILGVARLMSKAGGLEPEFAVVVGDPWQGKGVGAALMAHLIDIAKARGMTSIWGIALAENTQMIALARKLGFSVTRVPGEAQYELRTQF